MPKVVDLRNRFEQGSDLIFLLRGQISSPIFNVFQIPLQARTLAVSERAVQFVFFYKLPVVLAPLFLQRNELLRRDACQHLGSVVDTAIDNDSIARLDAVDKPLDVLALETQLSFPDCGVYKNRIVRELLIAGPFKPTVETFAAIVLLLRIEIEIVIGTPRENRIGLAVGQPHRIAACDQRNQNEQDYAVKALH